MIEGCQYTATLPAAFAKTKALNRKGRKEKPQSTRSKALEFALLCVLRGISLRPLRLKALFRRFPVIVHHALDAIFKKHDVKVDEQPNWIFSNRKMRQELSLIYRMQRFIALQFDHDPAFDN
jgi:hypothetical protein